ncbi:MAG: cell division protein FtsZ [Nevskiales bacterium]
MATEVFELVDNQSKGAVIKVIGIGGGGCNTVNQMVEAAIAGVDFVSSNTDVQHLERCKAETLLQIGGNLTRGLGAGANPDVGRKAAEEDRDRIRDILSGTDMLFITAGMGGGTGTGAAPIFAAIARELGILTLAVVTKPFPFEQKKRMAVAMKGIEELQQHVDSLIVIPNEKLQTVLGKNSSMRDAFRAANNVLQNAVQGISEIITAPGLINVDFADVRKVMSVQGKAMLGLGSASGENRAREAAEQALASPLLEDMDLHGAQGILVNVTADDSITMQEFQTINEIVTDMAAEDAEVIVGSACDPNMGGSIRVTVVATGLGKPKHALKPEQPKVVIGLPFGTPKAPQGGSIYDKPAYIRNEEQKHRAQQHAAVSGLPEEQEIFDVPAFLRKQAN